MDMELGIGTEDYSNDASYIAKGKRTKRPRPLSPCAVATAATITSSSSSASGHDYRSFSSTTTTEDTDHEEEDMANCLILLAQGKREENKKTMREKGSNSNQGSSADVATNVTATTKIGYYIYECKTCNRTFPSFQALGGHRASHKRPKVTPDEKKPPLITNCEFEETKQARVITTPPISLQLGCGASNNNKANKVHECSICGSEFASGQALGGHMRRHRASTGANIAHVAATETSSDAAVVVAATVEIKPRKVLELDLNLPAPPEEDHRDSNKFHFAATHKSLVVSAAPALVGCHY